MTSHRVRDGLTIVEVLIAILLIAVLFAVLAATQVSSLRMTRASQQGSQATQLAVDRLNQLTSIVLADYSGYQGCPGATLSPGCTGTQAAGDYSVSHVIARGSGYEASGLIQLSVAVTGPATANLSSFVSCMDFSEAVLADHDSDSATEDILVARTPTIREPGVCAP